MLQGSCADDCLNISQHSSKVSYEIEKLSLQLRSTATAESRIPELFQNYPQILDSLVQRLDSSRSVGVDCEDQRPLGHPADSNETNGRRTRCVVRTREMAAEFQKPPNQLIKTLSSDQLSEPCLTLAGHKGIRTTCERRCPCRCHHRYSIMTPYRIPRYLGRFNMQLQNVSWWRPACNIRKCQRNARSRVSFQYTLPSSLFATMISACYMGGSTVSTGLDFVPICDSPVFYFALSGQVNQLRDYYSKGLASIYQVDPYSGYDALIVSIIQNFISKDDASDESLSLFKLMD